ncbi:hypothetical protein TNCV_1186371 [Trichonephila clavipes]|nr:hypothetical protein TNCV_1186371 [Trichonephila clavipes]
MFTEKTMHHSSTSEGNDKGSSQELFEIVATSVIAQQAPKDEGLLDAYKQLRCACHDDPCYEILHCNYQRLIHKRFQVDPEEEIQGIEIWELGGKTTNQPPW